MARRRRHSSGPVKRSIAHVIALVALLALAAAWAWRTPMGRAVRMGWTLHRMDAPAELPVPVQGVAARAVADTWGGPRSGGRRHEGVDIFSPRGTPVRSTTAGVVITVREGGLGGKQVWLLGPGGERHYYAHLEGWAPGIARFDIVRPGDLLGYVGDSGNAKGTPPHLHYGIYRTTGAYDPWPLLQRGVPAQVRASGQPRRRER